MAMHDWTSTDAYESLIQLLRTRIGEPLQDRYPDQVLQGWLFQAMVAACKDIECIQMQVPFDITSGTRTYDLEAKIDAVRQWQIKRVKHVSIGYGVAGVEPVRNWQVVRALDHREALRCDDLETSRGIPQRWYLYRTRGGWTELPVLMLGFYPVPGVTGMTAKAQSVLIPRVVGEGLMALPIDCLNAIVERMAYEAKMAEDEYEKAAQCLAAYQREVDRLKPQYVESAIQGESYGAMEVDEIG